MTNDLASRKTNDEPIPSARKAVWLLIFFALDVSVCMLSNTSASSICFSFWFGKVSSVAQAAVYAWGYVGALAFLEAYVSVDICTFTRVCNFPHLGKNPVPIDS